MLFSKTLNENLIETDSNNCNLSTNYQDQLETLITVGNNLFSKLNDSSPYKPYLNTYLKEARRVVSSHLCIILLHLNMILLLLTT